VSNALEGAHRRPQNPRLYIGGLAVAAVMLAVATGLLAAAVHGGSNAAQQRAAVLIAARQEAGNLTTLSQQNGGRDFDSVLAGSAGSLKQQLSQGRGAFLKALSANNVSSAGSVLDAGIVTVNSSTATVLLNVKATVRNKETYAPETRLYHWQAGLVYSGGRWLMTSLEFV
jgi:Mce-associated membrane protein